MSQTYELRQGMTIYKNGQPLMALHRCLNHTGIENPAGVSREDCELLAAQIVEALNERERNAR